jgi:hypothetical protein
LAWGLLGRWAGRLPDLTRRIKKAGASDPHWLKDGGESRRSFYGEGMGGVKLLILPVPVFFHGCQGFDLARQDLTVIASHELVGVFMDDFFYLHEHTLLKST